MEVTRQLALSNCKAHVLREGRRKKRVRGGSRARAGQAMRAAAGTAREEAGEGKNEI